MSIRIMTRVWEFSKQKGSALLLLLAISDFANDDGEAWPAVETLANKIRMSERYTQVLIAELVQAGELSVHAGASRYGSNIYTIPKLTAPAPGVNPASPAPDESGVRPDAPGVRRDSSRGEAGLAPGVNPASPDPSVLTTNEPSLKTLAAKPPRHPALVAFQEAAKSNPDRSQNDAIIAAVGQAPEDVAFWKKVVAAYCLLGWNKRNVANMLEYFALRELPVTNKPAKTGPQADRSQASLDALDAFVETHSDNTS